LKKFDNILISRQAGREAFLAFSPVLKDLKENESIKVSFDGVITFSPAWGDEFLTPLLNKYGSRLILMKTDNPSVKATLEILGQTVNK
jgi:hypothetical protein